MLVCHCNVVTDRQIREAISAGAREPRDVADLCGAGTDCLGCAPHIEDLLADAVLASRDPSGLRSLQARRRQRRRVDAVA